MSNELAEKTFPGEILKNLEYWSCLACKEVERAWDALPGWNSDDNHEDSRSTRGIISLIVHNKFLLAGTYGRKYHLSH